MLLFPPCDVEESEAEGLGGVGLNTASAVGPKAKSVGYKSSCSSPEEEEPLKGDEATG